MEWKTLKGNMDFNSMCSTQDMCNLLLKRLPPEAGCRLVAQSTPVRQKTKAVADKHNVNQTQIKTMQVKGTLNTIGLEVAIWKRQVRRGWNKAVAMIWQPWTTCSSSSISSTDLNATLPRKLYWRSYWCEHCDKMRSWQCCWIIPLLARIRNFLLPPSSKHRKSAKLPWRHSIKLSYWTLSFCLCVSLSFCLFVFLSLW